MFFIVVLSIFSLSLTLHADNVHFEPNFPDAVYDNSFFLENDYQLKVTQKEYRTLTSPSLAAHFTTNLIRLGFHCSQPSLECENTDSLNILSIDLSLVTVAEWFAEHLHDVGCFQHDTCCDLEYDENNEVVCIEGSEGENYEGTSWTERCSMFSASCMGENIAAGNYKPEDTLCQWLNSPGHRQNMCRSSFSSLGTGVHLGTNNYRYYWVQNFGGQHLGRKIKSGAVLNGEFLGYSSLAAGVALENPESPAHKVVVEVEDNRSEMNLIYGDKNRGAFIADISISSCDRYRFHAEFENFEKETFPPEGYFIHREKKEDCKINDDDDDHWPDKDAFPDEDYTHEDDNDPRPDENHLPDEDNYFTDKHDHDYELSDSDSETEPSESDSDLFKEDKAGNKTSGCSCQIIEL